MEKYKQISEDLSTLKQDLQVQLATKGVTVPDDTPLNKYPKYIKLVDQTFTADEADAEPSDLRYGKTAFVGDSYITGTLHSVTPYVLGSSVVVPEGIIEDSVTVSVTDNVKDSLTVTPGTADQNYGDKLFNY